MALSKRSKDILIVAMADRRSAQEITTAIDALVHIAEPAADVAALGTTTALSAAVVAAATIANSNLTAAVPAEPTKAEVDTGIDTLRTAAVGYLNVKADNVDVETLRTQVEARLDGAEAKIDAVITSLVAAGLMS